MKPPNPHQKSQSIRKFKPSRKPAGLFTASVAFFDASLLVLAFFLLVSPFVLQTGINITLPEAPLSGGARFSGMILSIPQGGSFYFNDELMDESRLQEALARAAQTHPESTLIIEADQRVPGEILVRAWNAAQKAGIRQISIATRIAIQQGSPTTR